MKILALTPSFYGPTGEAVNERQFITALSKKIEKVYVVTFVGFSQLFTERRREIKKHSANLEVIPIPIPQIHPLITYLTMLGISCLISIFVVILNSIYKRFKIDIIYIRNSFLSMGFLTFHSLAKKTVVKINSIMEEEVQANKIIKFIVKELITILDRFTLSKSKRIIVHNFLFYKKLAKIRLAKHNFIPLEVSAGVDLRLIERIKRVAKTKTEQNFINIGFVGTLTWWQGADILVRAVARLKNKYPLTKLYFIGDGEMREEIEKLCRSLNVPFVVTGFKSHEDALRYLSKLDIVVIPRRRTFTTESTIPLKLLESWAMGIPVVITSHEALKQKYRDYEDLLFVEPDPEDVARKIELLLSNRDLREKLSKRGIDIARNFDYEILADKFVKSLRDHEE